MNDDLIKLTIDCLTSNKMKYKLFGKVSEDELPVEKRMEYKEQIDLLFEQLFVNDLPNDLMPDIKKSFDHFIKKSIEYFECKKQLEDVSEEAQQDFVDKDEYKSDEER